MGRVQVAPPLFQNVIRISYSHYGHYSNGVKIFVNLLLTSIVGNPFLASFFPTRTIGTVVEVVMPVLPGAGTY